MALTAVAGCSFALSGPDPNRPKANAPECDTGKGLVGLDGLIGGSLAVAGLALLGNDEASGAAITGLLGVAFIASAVRGNTAVNECRTAIAAYHTRPYDPGPEKPQLADERPRIRPRTQPVVQPSPQPPTIMQPPIDPYADAEPDVFAKPSSTRPAPTRPAPTRPAPTRPASINPAPTRPAPAAEAEDWKDFWTEVP